MSNKSIHRSDPPPAAATSTPAVYTCPHTASLTEPDLRAFRVQCVCTTPTAPCAPKTSQPHHMRLVPDNTTTAGRWTVLVPEKCCSLQGMEALQSAPINQPFNAGLTPLTLLLGGH